jgi:hypothetical protein
VQESDDFFVKQYLNRKISFFDVIGFALNPLGENKIKNKEKKEESVLFAIYLFYLFLEEKIDLEKFQDILKNDPLASVFIDAFQYIQHSPQNCIWIIKNNYFLDIYNNFYLDQKYYVPIVQKIAKLLSIPSVSVECVKKYFCFFDHEKQYEEDSEFFIEEGDFAEAFLN